MISSNFLSFLSWKRRVQNKWLRCLMKPVIYKLCFWAVWASLPSKLPTWSWKDVSYCTYMSSSFAVHACLSCVPVGTLLLFVANTSKVSQASGQKSGSAASWRHWSLEQFFYGVRLGGMGMFFSNTSVNGKRCTIVSLPNTGMLVIQLKEFVKKYWSL